jgi:hypothetical protein
MRTWSSSRRRDRSEDCSASMSRKDGSHPIHRAVYASWNGATEIATWEVLAGRHQGRLESLGQVPRNGFETAMVVQTSDPYVAVRAKDRSGGVLGTSKVLRPES